MWIVEIWLPLMIALLLVLAATQTWGMGWVRGEIDTDVSPEAGGEGIAAAGSWIIKGSIAFPWAATICLSICHLILIIRTTRKEK